MSITRAFLKGLGVAVPVGIFYWVIRLVFDLLYTSWSPIITRLLPNPSFLNTLLLTLVFSVIALILIGYLTELIKPLRYLKKAALKIPIIRMVLGNHAEVSLPKSFLGKKAVIAHLGDLRVFGILMGKITIDRDGTKELMCKVFIPNSPFPATGFLFMFSPQNVEVLDVSLAQIFSQITTYGTQKAQELVVQTQKAPSV
ncbi:hypothetical protein J7L09_02250 [bacterium]|nr:hypothetical protein [bacterium]